MNTPASRTARRAGVVTTLAGTLGLSALLGCAVANAGAAHPGFAAVKVGDQQAPTMRIKGSPDEQVRTTGDQGTLRTSAVQGIVESSLQCDSTSKIVRVSCDIPSEVATPQVRAK